MESPFGRHIIADYFECGCTYLDHEQAVKDVMLDAAGRCGATVVGSIFHHFSPQGVTGVVVIAESHLAIHTWPEFSYASVDLFTCGTRVDPWAAFEYLKARLQASRWLSREVLRGMGDKVPIRHQKRVVGE
jgi:S-adenosylmethionine decarboxylase